MADHFLKLSATPESEGLYDRASSPNFDEASISSSAQSGDIYFIKPSTDVDFSNSKVMELIPALEAKRKFLDAQIKDYIRAKQQEYDEYEKNLRLHGVHVENTKDDNFSKSKNPSTNNPDKRTALTDVQLEVATIQDRDIRPFSGHESGDRTPVHERELELSQLVSNFLPLLEGRGSRGDRGRSESVPAVAPAASTSVESRRELPKRSVTEPLVGQRKSALRPPRSKIKSHLKKRVSIVIDDKIVRPSDSPELYDSYMVVEDPTLDQSEEIEVISFSPDSTTTLEVTLPTQQPKETLAQKTSTEQILDKEPQLSPKSLPTPAKDSDIDEQQLAAHEEPLGKKKTPSSQPTSAVDGKARGSISQVAKLASASFRSPAAPAPAVLDLSQATTHQGPDLTSQSWAGDFRNVTDSAVFTTYVGGISGSGVDRADRNSLGYPASLGASYMEQYAAFRRLSMQKEVKKTNQSRKDIKNPHNNHSNPSWEKNLNKSSDADDDFMGQMEGI